MWPFNRKPSPYQAEADRVAAELTAKGLPPLLIAGIIEMILKHGPGIVAKLLERLRRS